MPERDFVHDNSRFDEPIAAPTPPEKSMTQDFERLQPASNRANTALLLIDVINDLEFDGGDNLLLRALPMASALAALKRRAKARLNPTDRTLANALELMQSVLKADIAVSTDLNWSNPIRQ